MFVEELRADILEFERERKRERECVWIDFRLLLYRDCVTIA